MKRFFGVFSIYLIEPNMKLVDKIINSFENAIQRKVI